VLLLCQPLKTSSAVCRYYRPHVHVSWEQCPIILVSRRNGELGDVRPVAGIAPAVFSHVTWEALASVVGVGGRLVEEVAARCLVVRGRCARGHGVGGNTRAVSCDCRQPWTIRRRVKLCVIMVTHHVDLTNTSNHGYPECKLHNDQHPSIIIVIIIIILSSRLTTPTVLRKQIRILLRVTSRHIHVGAPIAKGRHS